MNVGRWRGALAVLGMLSVTPLACEFEESQSDRKFENEGMVCMEMDLAGRIYVTVTFPVCLSSSCQRVVASGCGVTKSGRVLQVTSHGTYEETGATACTDDCQSLKAECDPTGTIGLLEPGDYTVKQGTRSGSVNLMPFMEVCLFG
jgi:hypothetical protein